MNELPLSIDVESKRILKRLPKVYGSLATLRSIEFAIPDAKILINALSLQEAKDSSEIEDIVTTHDELYRLSLNKNWVKSHQAKEVQNYASALKLGVELIQEKRALTNKVILQIQERLEGNDAGFRKLPGTKIENASTGEVVHTPPQDPNEILSLMTNLEQFINDDEMSDLDPLVKMAIIHHQFESIHPFYDGNGRTGRIVNILYLMLQELQDLPILYMSGYIIANKADYYRLLQEARTEGNWEEWILYMLDAVGNSAEDAILLIKRIHSLMMNLGEGMQTKYKFYSRELLNSLFKYPYTKIDYLVSDLGITRITATKYLNELADDGILEKKAVGRSYYFINTQLVKLFK